MADGDDGRRWGVARWKRREPWQRIPELEGVEPRRAADVYEWADSRAWGTWSGRGTLAAMIAACVAYGICMSRLDGMWRRPGLAAGAVGVVVTAITIWAVTRGAAALIHPTLRRCVRAELGTHCAACDYDLRATPDPPPPADARCPECGKRIPRNVHRRTIAAPAARAAEDAPAVADVRGKGLDGTPWGE
jgi:hypothetical protein